MSLLFRLATVAVVALAALALGLGSASAHTELAGSEPREGQALTTAPRQITLTFIESVQPVSAQVSVRGPDGSSVTTGEATVSEAVVRQPVDITTDGSYLVAYRVIAQDGHPVSGEVTFSYAGAASSDTSSNAAGESLTGASPTTAAEVPVTDQSLAESAESDGAVSTALWWLLGGAVAVVVVLAVLVVRRRSSGG